MRDSGLLTSIIVPCYNEAESLPALIARFAELRRPDSDWELVLVNNGSRDPSAEILARELASPGRGFVRVVTVPPPNVGYGHGIVTGLRAARGEWLAWTHADLQTPPADVLAGIELLRGRREPQRVLVKGRRRYRPLRDTLFTLAMQLAALVLLWRWLPDVNGQPKCFHRSLLELATRPPVDLSLDLYFFWLARSSGLDVATFDVYFGKRLHGDSKWAFSWRSKIRNILRTIRFMLALRFGRAYPTA